VLLGAELLNPLMTHKSGISVDFSFFVAASDAGEERRWGKEGFRCSCSPSDFCEPNVLTYIS